MADPLVEADWQVADGQRGNDRRRKTAAGGVRNSEEGRRLFLERPERGLSNSQLPPATDVDGLATTLHTLLQGMSIEASDGASRARLEQVAAGAKAVLRQS